MARFKLRPNIASGVGRYSLGVRRNSFPGFVRRSLGDQMSKTPPLDFGQLIHTSGDDGWGMFVVCAQHERDRATLNSARNPPSGQQLMAKSLSSDCQRASG
jgi:hypothetical protein